MNLRKWIGWKLGRSVLNAIVTAIFLKSRRSLLNAIGITIFALFVFRILNGEGRTS